MPIRLRRQRPVNLLAIGAHTTSAGRGHPYPLGDGRHRVVEATDPHFAVGRSAYRIEDVNEVVPKFVGERAQRRRCSEPDPTILRIRTAVVQFPGQDALFAVRCDRVPPGSPALAGVVPSAAVERQIGNRNIEPTGDRPNEHLCTCRIDDVAIAEPGEGWIVAAKGPDPVLMAGNPLGGFDCLEVDHGSLPGSLAIPRAGGAAYDAANSGLAALGKADGEGGAGTGTG